MSPNGTFEIRNFAPSNFHSDAVCQRGDPVELSLILPQWQLEAIEQAAHGNGITTGQMLRRVIGEFFDDIKTWPAVRPTAPA